MSRRRVRVLDEPVVVALVQPDGRLVEDVEHPDQRRADLRGQADALRLAARERRGPPLEGEVRQAHVPHEPEPRLDLLQDLARDLAAGPSSSRAPERRRAAVLDGQARDLVDARAADGDGEDLGLEAPPAAGGALASGS